MSIAVQTAVGPVGGKATTELTCSFVSMIDAGTFQFGAGPDGLFLLNSGEQDNSEDYTRSFTLATSDYGIKNPKWPRFAYIGIETDSPFTLSLSVDRQTAKTYMVTPNKTGLQRIRVPLGRYGDGRYWTLKISSEYRFRIDQINGLFIVRSVGIRSY